MSVLVYETDVGIQLTKLGKFKNLKYSRGEMPFEVELDDVSNLKGDNAALLQQVADKCWPIVKKQLDKLIKDLGPIDEEKDDKKRQAAAKKEIEDCFDEIYDDVYGVACKVFKDFAKDKKDYKKFKIKSGIKIAISGASLAGAIGLTAASGWSGAGTVVGVIGMVRSAASLAQQIANLAVDSEKIYDRIVANILKMRKQLASPGIKENTAKQIAATVMNKVFAVEIETLLVTVDQIETDFELLENRVKGNKVNVVSLANDIPNIMKKQTEITKRLDELKEIGVRTKKQNKEQDKLEGLEKKYEKSLDSLLKEITKLSDTIDKIEKWTVQYHREIASLNQKFSGKATKIAAAATDLVIAAGSFAAANFSDTGSLVQDLHNHAKVVVTAIALTQDGAETLHDTGKAAYDIYKEANG